MRLVIGGRASGKLAYVKSLGYREDEICDGAAAPMEALFHCPVIYRLHEAVRRWMQSGGELQAPEEKLMSCRPEIVVCDEVGAGIVPLDPFEREYREAVGRLCCQLAGEAEAVVRLYCGIPSVIKGGKDEA